MNSAANGWWMNGRLYDFNDPDEMVFTGFPAADNLTRLISAIVGGTVFLDGDDLSSATGQGLAAQYLTHPAMNAVARLGKAFRPVEGNTGSSAPDLFVMQDAGATYLAVFNWGSSNETRTVDLARAGLSATKSYQVTDLWTGTTSSATGTLAVALDTHASKLLTLQ